MAECVFRHTLPLASGDQILSAGLEAPGGAPIHPLARSALARRGYDVPPDSLATRLVTPMLDWADLVLAMETVQRLEVVRRHPVVAGKVRTLGHWLGREVEDPVRGDEAAFDATLQLIELGADSWLSALIKQPSL